MSHAQQERERRQNLLIIQTEGERVGFDWATANGTASLFRRMMTGRNAPAGATDSISHVSGVLNHLGVGVSYPPHVESPIERSMYADGFIKGAWLYYSQNKEAVKARP